MPTSLACQRKGASPKQNRCRELLRSVIAARSGHGRRHRTRHFRCRYVYLVPDFPQHIAAIGKEVPIGCENFERDRAVIAALLQRAQMAKQIEITAPQWQMEINCPAFVVMQMDVAQP